jgi:hypothetical protein
MLQSIQDELKQQREMKAKLVAIDHAHQTISISLGIWSRNKADETARQRIAEGLKSYQAALEAALGD